MVLFRSPSRSGSVEESAHVRVQAKRLEPQFTLAHVGRASQPAAVVKLPPRLTSKKNLTPVPWHA
jgi:hypothetical protein